MYVIPLDTLKAVLPGSEDSACTPCAHEWVASQLRHQCLTQNPPYAGAGHSITCYQCLTWAPLSPLCACAGEPLKTKRAIPKLSLLPLLSTEF